MNKILKIGGIVVLVPLVSLGVVVLAAVILYLGITSPDNIKGYHKGGNSYGRVVDQNGDGVPGVEVVYYRMSSFFSRTENGYSLAATTDQNGFFVINNDRGGELKLYIPVDVNDCCQFPRNHLLPEFDWEINSSSNPLIINVWRVYSYPDLKKGDVLLRFIPDGRAYTIDFFAEEKVQEKEKITGLYAVIPNRFKLNTSRHIKKEGEVFGDLRIWMKRSETEWEMEIQAIDGGLIKTKDMFTNLAPKNGYTNTFNFGGLNFSQHIRENFYFRSRKGELYGYVKLRIMPEFRDDSAISFDFKINLEKGRNLTVEKK
ncbi:MAG: carboxypeptidase regulatory-like domain-containing protein [Gammaproteobacteria bacterium]|nr:carboxypeptidase regulatory-like domain-containing protein [Gammaproteobacteria bacterium]